MLTKKLSLSLIIPALLVAGCNSGSEQQEVAPTFSLAVSDAPVDELSSVVVCFNQIELKRSETAGGDLKFLIGSDESAIAANDLCVDNSESLISNTVGIDLLEYPGRDSISLLDRVSIEAGDYSQLRLTISEGSYGIDEATGKKVSISIPSNELKLDGFSVSPGGVVDLTLEFDLRNGMTNPVGKSGYFLKPRGVRLVSNSESGHIAGTVSETLLINNQCVVAPADLTTSVATVYLYQDADLDIATLADNGGAETVQPLASTNVTYDGAQNYNFEIGFVNVADYTIAVSCDIDDNPEADDEVVFIEAKNVSVVAGNTPSQVDFGDE